MTELEQESKMHPLTMTILTLLTGGLGFVLIGPLIGIFVAIPFFEGDFLEQLPHLANPTEHPELKLPLYIIQGCTTLLGLALIPAALSFGVFRKGITSFFSEGKIYVQMLIVILVMTTSFMAPNSLFNHWNVNFHFPEFMGGFEQWARKFEDQQQGLTEFLTKFSSTGEFLLAFVVIAVFPAFAEEFLFRGMIQNQLFKASRNIHIAIWTSAILFSAFHLQFFGFVPRMLLGALFGYLYYWSGSLWMPMFAHFVNNGFAVTMLYLNQRGVIDVDVESTDVAPWPVVIIFTLLFCTLVLYYKNFFDRKKSFADGR